MSSKRCSNVECSKLGLQPLTSFTKNPHRRDGFNNQCKTCHALYYSRNKTKILANMNANYVVNKEDKLSYMKSYNNLHKEDKAAYERTYAKANPSKINAIGAKRRAAKRKAVPKWLTKEQLLEIQWYYDTAKELQWLSEESLEVDHIVPLQGENVSGLHVPWNLQILPESMNCSKGNKYE